MNCNADYSSRSGRVPKPVLATSALVVLAAVAALILTRRDDTAPALPKGEVLSVKPLPGYEPKFTETEKNLLRDGPVKGDTASERDYALLLARFEADPVARSRRIQMVVGNTDGYGMSEPIPDAGPQARSVMEALKTKRFPERLTPTIAPKSFDPVAYKADPKAYLDVAEPGRVFQGKAPAPGVPEIVSVSPYAQSVKQGESVELSVKAAPGYPVTFTSFDLGRFKESGLVTVTVPADASGVATVRYEGVSGTILDSTVLASSPMSSGRVRFKLTTLVRDDASVASAGR